MKMELLSAANPLSHSVELKGDARAELWTFIHNQNLSLSNSCRHRHDRRLLSASSWVELWTFIHNMRVGCGIEVRVVKGRRYLYFWSYGPKAGLSRRSWRYLGQAGMEETKRKALTELIGHYSMERGEMERRLRIVRTRLARMQ